jgi:phage portal protein BeeE
LVRLISQTVAGMPLIMYKREQDDVKRRVSNHPLYELLHDRPNRIKLHYWESKVRISDEMANDLTKGAA